MSKIKWMVLLLSFWACTTQEEKGRILMTNEITQSLPYPDSFKLIEIDTLDCYDDTKNCILRVTYSHNADSILRVSDLSFIVINEALSIKGLSDDIREIGDFVKLSTYHNYAKNIDFASKHLIGDFDIVSSVELKKIDLESRGLQITISSD